MRRTSIDEREAAQNDRPDEDQRVSGHSVVDGGRAADVLDDVVSMT